MKRWTPNTVLTSSPTKIVKFVNDEGEVVKEVSMNRATRRKLKIGRR